MGKFKLVFLYDKDKYFPLTYNSKIAKVASVGESNSYLTDFSIFFNLGTLFLR